MKLEPILEIQGIKFFDNAPACISHFEKKTHWTKKAISLIQSFGNFFIYALNKISLVLHRVDAKMDPLANTKINALSKKRLVVCIHGLHDNPSQFKKIVDEMQKKQLSETDIFIPRVLQKGNAKLDEMVNPIFQEIVKWAKTSGEKELVLVGVSNGGRIARAIEAKLGKVESTANIKRLRFISVVGACKGSSFVNLINKIGLSWLLSKNISKEMPVNSIRNEQLDRDWKKGFFNEYFFIASPHDLIVPNYSSSLMTVDKQKGYYAIVPGHRHNSIINAVTKTVAEIILI